MDKPAFDPSQPFQVADKPPFDPSKPFEAAPSVGFGEDAAKAVGSGLASFTAGTLGGAGDLRSAASAGISTLGDKLGVAPDKVQAFKDLATKAANLTPYGAALANAPTSRDIINSADPIVSPDYQPQYEANKLLKKGVEFAPGALVGEGGLASRILTGAVLPAIGSEIGEKVAGPYGGVAGAVLAGGGGMAAARKARELASARSAANAMPTGEQLLKTGSNQFDQARAMDIVTEPSFAQKTANNMRAAVKEYDPEAQKAVFNVIDRVENMGKPASLNITPEQRLQAEMNWEKLPVAPPALPVEMNNIELARKQLSKLRMSADPSTRSAAKAAQDALTESQAALLPSETLAGNAADYTKTLRQAIGNYGAGKRAATIQGKMNLAELNTNSPVGMLDMASGGQALQRTMKQLARPINNTNVPVARKLGFNNEEVAAITNAANGNNLTHLGDLANHVVPHWLGGGAVSSVLRAMGGLSVKRQVSALDSLVRSRSPLAAQVAAQMPQAVNQLPAKTQRLLRSLALARPSIAQLGDQRGQSVSQSPAY